MNPVVTLTYITLGPPTSLSADSMEHAEKLACDLMLHLIQRLSPLSPEDVPVSRVADLKERHVMAKAGLLSALSYPHEYGVTGAGYIALNAVKITNANGSELGFEYMRYILLESGGDKVPDGLRAALVARTPYSYKCPSCGTSEPGYLLMGAPPVCSSCGVIAEEIPFTTVVEKG